MQMTFPEVKHSYNTAVIDRRLRPSVATWKDTFTTRHTHVATYTQGDYVQTTS